MFFIVLLVITQTSSIIFLIYQINDLRTGFESKLNIMSKSFTKSLDEYDLKNQENFNEIAQTLKSQQNSVDSFQKQVNIVKSSGGDYSGVIARAIKSVVSVTTDKATGSGFIISEDGYIVTNEHVIAKATKIKVTTSDQIAISAELIGYDSLRDVALLKVNGTFEKLTLGNSDYLEIGRKVIAIGKAFKGNRSDNYPNDDYDV